MQERASRNLWRIFGKKTNLLKAGICYTLMLSLPINQPLASVYFSNNKAFHKLLHYSIHSQLTDNLLYSLFLVNMNACFVHSEIRFVKW